MAEWLWKPNNGKFWKLWMGFYLQRELGTTVNLENGMKKTGERERERVENENLLFLLHLAARTLDFSPGWVQEARFIDKLFCPSKTYNGKYM